VVAQLLDVDLDLPPECVAFLPQEIVRLLVVHSRSHNFYRVAGSAGFRSKNGPLCIVAKSPNAAAIPARDAAAEAW
jgi:hypothetical protein